MEADDARDSAAAAAAESLELETELAIGALDQGGEEALERFLGVRPRLAPELRRRLDRLRTAGLLTTASRSQAPLRFGEFEVVREVAAGGMGVVYLAEQTSLQRQVALKVVRPEFLGSETARERFQREVEAVARLSHPGIVPILAVGLEGAVPWFAMEFVAGVTLDAVVRSVKERGVGRTSAASLRELVAASGSSSVFAGSYQEFVVRLALQVAQAMSYVHARGIVHRDLKPSNIMLTAHGQAMLLDFGLAHVQTDRRLTRTHATLGSPAYMSPEQVRGEAVDERVDVYGLGVTLYELLTTQLPFDGPTPEAVHAQVLDGACRPVDRVHRAVTHDLSVVVSVAMDKDRNRRYGSMAELAQDLERVLQRQPILARPLPRSLRMLRWCQRRPAAATALAALLFLLLQFPLVLWWFQAAANVQLQQHNRELEVARLQEADARALATVSFEDAYVAIHDLLERTASLDLVSTPGSESLRLTLLKRALALYQRLLSRRPDEVRLIVEECRTRQKLGALLLATGDYPAAEREFAEVVTRLAAVRTPEASGMAGITRKLWAQALLYRGRLDEALAMSETGRCDLDEALRELPSVVYRTQAAELLNTLASIREQRGERQAWFDLMHEALDIKRGVHVEAPRSFAAANAFALGCSNVARALAWRNRRAEALERIAEGIDALLQCSPAESDSVALRAMLAVLYCRRGQMLNESGRQEEAESAYGDALGLCLELCEEHPEVAQYADQAGQTLHNMAITHLARRDYEAALRDDEQAIVHLKRARAQAPSRASYRRDLEYALVSRCVSLLSLRRLDELGLACRELAELAVTTEGMLNAARVSIRHAQLTSDTAEAQALRSAASRLVVRAVDAGFRDRSHFVEGRFAALYKDLDGDPVYDAAIARL